MTEHTYRTDIQRQDLGGEQAESARAVDPYQALRNLLAQMNEEGIELSLDQYAELETLITEALDAKRRIFVDLRVCRSLGLNGSQLTNDQIAGTLGVTRKTLYNWTKECLFQLALEIQLRKWRKLLALAGNPTFHPIGFAFEIQAILADPELSHSRRLKAIAQAAEFQQRFGLDDEAEPTASLPDQLKARAKEITREERLRKDPHERPPQGRMRVVPPRRKRPRRRPNP